MMKGRILIKVVCLIIITLFQFGCSKDKIYKGKISGFVQKGPFINGTSITLQELNGSLVQTGRSFSSQIENNTGSFELRDVELQSGFVELIASGYYFNEVLSHISSAPLTLGAIVDITDKSSLNVNLLTHLEKERIKYLVQEESYDFQQARRKAQEEVMAVFGFSADDVPSSEDLSISGTSTWDGMLLAVSVIMQAKLSVGELSELIAGISGDIRTDGDVDNGSLIRWMRNYNLDNDPLKVKLNIQDRNHTLGITQEIPPFEPFMDIFFEPVAGPPVISWPIDIGFGSSASYFNSAVNPNNARTVVTFEYGPTAEYGTTVSPAQSNYPFYGGVMTGVQASANNLVPNTTYHLRIKAENAKGIVYSRDTTFTTLGSGGKFDY